MKRNRLKGLLETLSYEEQRTLVYVYLEWMCQSTWNDIQSGVFPVAADQIDSVTRVDPETVKLLDKAVETDDANGSLKSGISEIIRSLPIMQRETTGAQLNIYFKKYLPETIFNAVYESIGLETNALPFDRAFQTEIPGR